MTQRNRSDPGLDELNAAMQQMLSRTFGRFAPRQAWSPNVNIYQCPDRLMVCVDLAGVDRDRLAVRVEPGRLEIRGERAVPDPSEHGERPTRILSMEIDDGAFCRTIRLPTSVRLDAVTSRYREGMLWVELPLSE